jgi:hypothetical protein
MLIRVKLVEIKLGYVKRVEKAVNITYDQTAIYLSITSYVSCLVSKW